MSKEQELRDFIDLNQEAFKILQKYIKALDTVRGINSVQDFKARTLAIDIINGWLTELWGMAYPELPQAEEDDDIYRTIIKS